MGSGSAFFIIIRLGFLFCSRNVAAQYYRYYPYMDRMCNQSLLLDCPFMYARAGIFRYDNIPNMSPGLCYFNVTLPADCGISTDSFAVYFNIRKFLLPSTDRVRIYQTDRLASRILLKELTGSHSARSNPSSVAQALTSYVKQPSFTFEYFRGTSPSTELHQAGIDFVVVESSPGLWNAYCPALSGYVDDYFFCHTDGSYDRVNCPHNFAADVYALNPAYLRQPCPFKSPPSFENNEPIYEYWNTYGIPGSSKSSSLNFAIITGIAFGCVLCVLMIIAAVYVVRSARRRTSPSRPIVPSTNCTMQLAPLLAAMQHDATNWPAVLDDPVAPPPPFTGAPPSYSQVTAAPVLGGIPPPPFMGAPPSYSQATAAPELVGISVSNPPSYKSRTQHQYSEKRVYLDNVRVKGDF
ncbi:uncharacterized protein LOC129596519 [Paramacrobiotus metropolitanus]|uniref:uncharacterized protein LOC129596519 n=1 Tax=Paramacrobiotus metropolitanus TaxID=2943436 RepID=UPI00244619D0|nr:uncharacterized protein LOC129596519 [Paramacrobiotus metropolitanus]